MPITKHPNGTLQAAFKGYQGADPDKARVIILGKDANIPEIIDANYINETLEYLKNGPDYWTKKNVHHPCAPDGPLKTIPYHENFAKMELGSLYRHEISFVEILDYLTIGNSGNHVPDWINGIGDNTPGYSSKLKDAPSKLEKWICGPNKWGHKKIVFIPLGLIKLFTDLKKDYKLDLFPCISWEKLFNHDVLEFHSGVHRATAFTSNNNFVLCHHLAAGSGISDEELYAITGLIQSHLDFPHT